MSLRIGVDSHAAEKEGTGNCSYIQNLLLALSRLDRENEYFIYVTDPAHKFYQKLRSYQNFRLRPLKAKNPLLRIPVCLAAFTWLDKIDLLHVQYISPPVHRGKLVVTVHDLAHFFLPHSFSRFEVWRSRLLIPYTVKRAQKILTGSGRAKADLVKKFRLPEEKVIVAPAGVAGHFRPLSEPQIEEILRKHCLSRPFILSLGRLNRRKNIPVLIEAFSLLKRDHQIPHKLVIAGVEDIGAKEIREMAAASGQGEEIIFTGFIPEENLPAFYNGADIFVFISEFEGFGLPVLEAMACGTPVISSAATSLPEVAGEAALYVQNINPREVAEKIARLLTEEKLRLSLRARGLQQAQNFSWATTAALTFQAYKEALK